MIAPLLPLLLLALSVGQTASNSADEACAHFLTTDTDYPPAGLQPCPPTQALAKSDKRFIFDPTSLIDPFTHWHPGASVCYIQ
jgi:hypothetical protein